jgi:CRISPR-associated protein Cas1
MYNAEKGATGLQLRTLFVTTPGYVISASNHHLTFRYNKKQIGKIPLMQVRQIIIREGVTITSGALDQCLSMDLPITFLKKNGELNGHLLGARRHDPNIRIAQHRIWEQKEMGLEIVRKIVTAKISNTLTVLRKHLYNHKENSLVADAASRIKRYRRSVASADTVEEIRGYEGITAKEYFSVFGSLLRKTFTFESRNRRPPKDPVNALLSLGYTIIAQECAAMLEACGLDSYIGFLHEIKPGRPSLALDIIEPFRSASIDAFIIKYINLGIFKHSDFEQAPGTAGAVLLNMEGRKKFYAGYEDSIGCLHDDMTEELWSPRSQIESECMNFKKAIVNNNINEWNPYLLK